MPAPRPVSPVPTIDCVAQAKIDAGKPHPNKKKIFVFCDGTGNQFRDTHSDENGNSNVVKLYTTLRVTNEQVAYYHPGVGTMGDPTIRYALPRFWSKVKGLAFGAGFQANVLDAYRYLMDVYNDGDDIYLFGFSRGAYTARALAGMLHGYGLLCPGNEGHLVFAWRMFHDELTRNRKQLKKARKDREEGQPHRIKPNFAFMETYSRKVRIRFIGVWDTVSSVGWIYEPVRLLGMAQNPILDVGRHAVSIDERRAYYRDNLWGPAVPIDDPEWPAELRAAGVEQDIAQVWFPGVHSDVGGSYRQSEASPANVTLEWMIDELKNHGAELCQERIDMVLGHKSGVYSSDTIYWPKPHEDHCVHESLDWKWWLLQVFPQQYYDKEDGEIQWRVPYGTPRSIPARSLIHGSAARRMESKGGKEKPYRPLNLSYDQLRPIEGPISGTTANLSGCYIYEPEDAEFAASDSTPTRVGKLVVGWICFGVFWLVIAAVAWCVVSVIGIALMLVLSLISREIFFLEVHMRPPRRIL